MHTLSSGSTTRTLRWCTAEETQDLYSRHLSSCAPQARAASSVAVKGTMPPRTQHPLVHVLLLWVTILTVVQVVFIALFFTNGHMVSSDRGPLFGRMLSFTAKKEGTAVTTITWISTNGLDDLVSSHKNILTLQKDGYYFLNLRVTLDSFSALTPFTVRLRNGGKRLLEGPINPDTNSTGLLGKAEELTAQTELSVYIDPQPVNIKYTASVTHLDIIYMPKPRKNQS